jgi:hypothetical protein
MTLRLDPVPDLASIAPDDRLWVDEETMTFAIGPVRPPLSEEQVAQWRALREQGALTQREARMLAEIERLRGNSVS